MYQNLNPSTVLSPVPVVMISCCGKEGELARDNIITVAWAGTVCSEPPMVSISVRKSRLSHGMISESGEFVVNLVSEKLAEACDFCGVKSGRELDKFAKLGLVAEPMEGLSYAKGIAGAPVQLGCVVREVKELGSHDMFLAEIVSVRAKEKLFDSKGKLCLDRAKLVAYNHGEYFSLGRKLGFFGYSVASPEVRQKRMGGGKRGPAKKKKRK